MAQTVNFKENDTLHITVMLPSGEVLQLEPNLNIVSYNQYGDLLPIEPAPFQQVSIQIEVTRP